MIDKFKIKYQSDPKLRQRVKLIGAGCAVLFVLYLVAEFVLEPKPDRPKVSYGVQVDTLINNQAENPFEQEGIAARVTELKEMYRRGTSEHDQRIAELEKKLSEQVQENRGLETRVKSVQTETRDEFEDRFEILAQQFEKRLLGAGNNATGGPEVAMVEGMPSWEMPTTGSTSDAVHEETYVPEKQSAKSSYADMMSEWEHERDLADITNNGNGQRPETGRSSPSPLGMPGSGQKLNQKEKQKEVTELAVNIVNRSGRFTLSEFGTVVSQDNPEDTESPDPSETVKRDGATVVTSREQQERMSPDKPKAPAEAFMPAGSLISGVLMTGVDAPTDKSASAEPHPVLIRVKKEAILPSRYRLDIRECFIIGSAHAKLNTSRAYIRAERISCVRDDGGVIESPMKAYAVGGDAKHGLAGTIVSRQGTVIARSIVAGFLSGLSTAFTPAQVPVVVDSTNGNQIFSSARPQDVGAVAGYNGLATAAEKVSEYYLRIAEDLYPVVEINAGRKIDLILIQGMKLAIRG